MYDAHSEPPAGMRYEPEDRELFFSINEPRYVMDRWWMDYIHSRPHSSMDMAPATFTAICLEQGSSSLHLTQDKENL